MVRHQTQITDKLQQLRTNVQTRVNDLRGRITQGRGGIRMQGQGMVLNRIRSRVKMARQPMRTNTGQSMSDEQIFKLRGASDFTSTPGIFTTRSFNAKPL